MPADLERYRASEREKARTASLLGMLPKNRASILDIGARDGFFSRILTEHFSSVTALDLTRPSWEYAGVRTVAGDTTALQFHDGEFDCVLCAEVLEHIPALEKACREISRVARYEVLIGVPYRQDTRVGRTTCLSCGKTNPPWGHINTFDEERLRSLFADRPVLQQELVGETKDATNALSTWLMDLGGNPWGVYAQDEPCTHCGATLVKPTSRSFPRKVSSALGARLYRLQQPFVKPQANWIHILFGPRR